MSARFGRAFLGLLRAEGLVFLRDRISLFFTLLLPLLFIVIFGFLMGGGTNKTEVGYVISEDRDGTLLAQILDETEAISASRFADAAALEAAVEGRKVGMGLVWDGERLRFLVEAAQMMDRFAFEEIGRGIVARFDLARQGTSPAIALDAVALGNPVAARQFNRAVPGILAFSLLATGLFAVSGHLTAMKGRKTLDRLLTTPMPPLALLLAIVAIRLVVALLASLATISVARLLFGLEATLDWGKFLALSVASTVGMMGLGTGIALLVRRPQSAGNVSNILAVLMMFLCGITIPIEFLPPFLRAVSRGLPLTYLAQGMRYATGVEEMPATRFWAIILGLLLLALITFPLLARYVVRAERR
jgi:ABC-2 type transport system permease protein